MFSFIYEVIYSAGWVEWVCQRCARAAQKDDMRPVVRRHPLWEGSVECDCCSRTIEGTYE